MSLVTPEQIRRLQRALYVKAKQEPARRFHFLHATPCHTGSGTAASAPAWPSRRALVGASESFQELPGSRQSPHLGSFERTPNQGSFPHPALPGFIGRMSPSDSCWTRPPKGRCHRCRGRPNRSPVLQVTACAYVLRPLPRRAGQPSDVGASGRPRRPSSDIRRLGARVDIFEACSGFTRVAARTLAGPPKADLCPQGFDGLVTLAISWVATKAYRHLLGPDSHRLR